MSSKAEFFLQKHLNGGLDEAIRSKKKPDLPALLCGATLISVQASTRHACVPQQDFGVFDEVEVRLIKGAAPCSWFFLGDGKGLFRNVPIDQVAEFMEACGSYDVYTGGQHLLSAPALLEGGMVPDAIAFCNDIAYATAITQAGFLMNDVAAIENAEARFWLEIVRQFPEMTSGDSELRDEPCNAIALWIAQSMQVPLNEQKLAFIGSPLPHHVDDERFHAALDAALQAARNYLQMVLPEIADPSERVRQQMAWSAAHVLHWNFPNLELVEAETEAWI